MEVAKRARTLVFYKSEILTRCQPEVTDIYALLSDVSEQGLLELTAILEHPLALGSSLRDKDLEIIGTYLNI